MLTKQETELIANYVLESEDNLEVALKIASAFSEIKKKIIINFLEALEDALKEFLDDQWIIRNELKENIDDKNKGFYIAKKEWGDSCSIGIAPDRSGARSFYFGVMKNPEKIPEPIAGGRVKKLLDENYRQGLPGGDWWEWWQWVDESYRNWDKDNQEGLIKLYRKDEAVDYFKEHISIIKEIAGPVIDEVLTSKKE